VTAVALPIHNGLTNMSPSRLVMRIRNSVVRLRDEIIGFGVNQRRRTVSASGLDGARCRRVNFSAHGSSRVAGAPNGWSCWFVMNSSQSWYATCPRGSLSRACQGHPVPQSSEINMSTKNTLQRFLADESGASMAEYALLLGVIVVALVGALTTFRTKIQGALGNAGNNIN